jgi:hypothetical protein
VKHLFIVVDEVHKRLPISFFRLNNLDTFGDDTVLCSLIQPIFEYVSVVSKFSKRVVHVAHDLPKKHIVVVLVDSGSMIPNSSVKYLFAAVINEERNIGRLLSVLGALDAVITQIVSHDDICLID